MADNKKTRVTQIPLLRVSDKEKRKNKFEHTKNVIDYYIESSFFDDESVTGGYRRDIYEFYEAYNNNLPDSYFHYVTNPFNSSNDAYTNWPARIRPYTIIRPNVDLLLGEYEKRPFSYFVKVNNADAVNLAQDEINRQLVSTVEQMFINKLNESGEDTGIPNEKVEDIQTILGSFEDIGLRDNRAIQGQAALDIVMDDLFLQDVFKREFKDYIIAGETYSYKGVRRGDIEYDRVSPLDLDYDKSPDLPYVEDGQWVVRRMFLTYSDLVDMFYDELTEDEHLLIEDMEGGRSFRAATYNSLYGRVQRDDEDLRRNKIEVYHVCWKYKKKMGILTYFNEDTLEMEEIEVPETYKPEQDEEVEWFWVNEVWEGYRIDTDIHLGIQPVEPQRSEINNFSACKLPYNGKRFSDTHSQNVSIVELGLPYEIMYRILHFQLEKTIAKSKGKIAVLDINALPRKNGWDEERAFYWADAQGYMLTDRNAIGADKGFAYQVLDMGLYEHINNLIQVMEFIKHEWDEVVGITRQRKGDIKASETASGINAARYQSSVISESVFSSFESFVQKELLGLIDCSKLAWVDGLKRVHMNSDLHSVLVDIDPAEYASTEFGLVVTNSAKDIEQLNMTKQMGQAFAQNGAKPSDVVDVIRANSMAKIKQLLKKSEMEAMKATQNAAENEREAEERQLSLQNEYNLLEKQAETLFMNAEYDRKEDLELTKIAGQNIDSTDTSTDNAEIELKQRELALKERDSQRKVDSDAKDRVSKEKIEKLKAKVALKNKVPGEK